MKTVEDVSKMSPNGVDIQSEVGKIIAQYVNTEMGRYRMQIFTEKLSEISFKNGVEFAQRWIQVDRCTNGYITANSLSDIERNLPVIMNDEDGDKDDEYVIIKYISDLLDMDESFTHWRPVNLK